MIAKSGAACCLMHNRESAEYRDFFPDFLEDMRGCIRIADAAGIPRDRIILDPGVGFGKTYEMNLAVIDHLEILHELGLPVLLGTSRKSPLTREKKAHWSPLCMRYRRAAPLSGSTI